MSNPVVEVEERSLRQIADEYRRQGYTVLVRPGKDERPAFLADYEPDLIATSEHERVIVEVKSRAQLHGAVDLVPLAEVVDAHPGWRLDLIVPDAVDSPEVPKSAVRLSSEEIQARLVVVRHLAGSHQDEAALVLVWSAAEATLRALAARYAIDLENDQPTYILKKMYSLGAISREDYEFLRDATQVRNAIVHGYRTTVPGREAIDRMVRKVEEFLRLEAAQPTT